MIQESLIQWVCDLLISACSVFEFINLPIDAINVLTTLLAYGVWVVGSDILLLFSGSVLLWFGVKSSLGLLVWLWKLLPFT